MKDDYATPAYTRLKNNTNPHWWRDPGLRKLNFYVAVLLLTQCAFGYDGALVNGLQTIPAWQSAMNYPKGIILGVIGAAYSMGALTSGAISSLVLLLVTVTPLGLSLVVRLGDLNIPLTMASYRHIADRWGRKYSVVIGAVIVVAGSIVTAAAPNRNVFIVGRLIVGIGSIAGATAAPTLITEIAHPRQRAPVTSMYHTCYYVGSITAAWFCFSALYIRESSWAWRYPSLFQGGPVLVQLIFIWFVPESPRWYVKKGRVDDARAVLARYHANGDINDELVNWEVEEIVNALMEEERRAEGWSAFFKTPGNRRRFWIVVAVAVFAQWNGVGLVSYYLAPILTSVGITNPPSQGAINGGLQIWNLICAVGGSMAVDKLGRRALWLGSTVAMLICYVIITACSADYANRGNTASGGTVVAFLFIYYGSYDVAYTPLLVAYPAELLPYGLRAKGMSIMWTFVFLALVFNQLVNPIALDSIGWKYYTVYIAALVFIFVIIWSFFPETRGRSLEEVAEIFDGKDIRPQMEHVGHQDYNGVGVAASKDAEARSDEGDKPLAEHAHREFA